MRLIDADVLMAEITEENPMVHFGPFGYAACSPDSGFAEKVFMRERVLEIVESAPTVDAVVLPCKLGETVFVLWRLVDPDICSKCPDFHWGGMGDSNECGKTEDGWRSPECIEIQEWEATLELILGWIRYAVFGKTVFLTRAEAEAALAKMKGLEDDRGRFPRAAPSE